jgi:glycosyltransferase involved in cell wall biosynthesis
MSLLSQSYPNFELIMIDDSSTDNTLQIMNKIKDGLDTDLESIILSFSGIFKITILGNRAVFLGGILL